MYYTMLQNIRLFIDFLSDLITTKYEHPLACGGNTFCDFGATCSLSDEYDISGKVLPTCLCKIDCSFDHHRQNLDNSLVCASDGNTYHSECHVRQHSCRIQTEMKSPPVRHFAILSLKRIHSFFIFII